MKTNYLHINKKLVSFLILTALVGAASVVPTQTGEAMDEGLQPRNEPSLKTEAASREDQPRRLFLNPGRVSFCLSPVGEWLRLVPAWTDGKSLISGGGVAVLALDPAGEVVEVADNTSCVWVEKKTAANIGTVYEGIANGARYPLVNSDDDGDGRENEDRLDGFDNDGDQRVDEDFAAVGDEMIVLGYEARTTSGQPLVEIHQECYAWSLPHIDGMVATKIVVKNVGRDALNDVRIGLWIQKQGDFLLAAQDLASSNDRGNDRLTAKGVLMSQAGETSVAALFFAEPSDGGGSWVTGVSGSGRRLADLLKAAIYTGDKTATEKGPEEKKVKPDSPAPDTAGRSSAQTGEESGRKTYGISPNLGKLRPGEEVTVYAALVAIPSSDRADQAIEDAYRTVVGDGRHRLVPPPMSITRRTVWGTYRESTPGVVSISLENLRGQQIEAADIYLLTGIDMSETVAKEQLSGDVEIELPEDAAFLFASAGSRVVLHGRLRSGEFFDVVLRPAAKAAAAKTPAENGPAARTGRLSEQDPDLYWMAPGKLDESYLTGSPNPFRESTTIFYEIPTSVSDEEGSVLNFFNPIPTSVKVYNVAGRLVNTLVDAILSPGTYNAQWDGIDVNGSSVASGVYYVKLQIGKKHVTKRLIQLK